MHERQWSEATKALLRRQRQVLLGPQMPKTEAHLQAGERMVRSGWRTAQDGEGVREMADGNNTTQNRNPMGHVNAPTERYPNGRATFALPDPDNPVTMARPKGGKPSNERKRHHHGNRK